MGISKEEAMEFMADNEFECSIVRNGTFSNHVRLPDGGYNEIVHGDIDFVLCVHIEDGSFSRPVKTKWMIAIVLNEDDNVEKVISRRDLIGP